MVQNSPYTVGDTSVFVSGKHLVLENKNCGITVEWDGSNKATVRVSRSNYAGKMTGQFNFSVKGYLD